MAAYKHGPASPVRLAVSFSLLINFVTLLFLGGLAGSYYLSLRAIQRQVMTQDQLRQRGETFQIRQAVPTCQAIVSMDQASHVPPRDFPRHPHNVYDERLSAAIHAINVDSHCPLILRDVAAHIPYTTILRQIQDGNGSPPAHRNAGTSARR